MSTILVSESLSDTLVTWLVLKRLVLPWNEWPAFKVGLIDDKGNKIKVPISSNERAAWSSFDRFIYNLRQVLEKFVGGSKMAHYLSAMYLLRDDIQRFGNKTNLLVESQHEFSGFSSIKQLQIYNFFRNMESKNISYIGDLELDIIKLLPIVEQIKFPEDFLC